MRRTKSGFDLKSKSDRASRMVALYQKNLFIKKRKLNFI